MRRLIPALALGPTSALGAVLTVPSNDYATVEAAVVASTSGDRIEVLTGTYDIELLIDKNLRIEAPTGNTVVFTTTGTSGTMIDVAGATNIDIRNITFSGEGNPDARAIRTTAVPVVQFTGVSATGLSSAGDGGFLQVSDAVLATINGGTFTGLAAANGGMVHISSTNPSTVTTLNLNGVTISDSTATANGGVVAALNANVSLTDTVIDDTAAAQGGVVHSIHDATATNAREISLQRSVLSNAISAGEGGALYAFGSAIEIEESTLTDNMASVGGAIWMDQGDRTAPFEVTDGTLFSGNLSTTGGAAFHVVASQALLSAVTVETGIADSGGHLEALSVVLTDVDLLHNQGLTGGGLRAISDEIDIVGGLVHANQAANGGGLALTTPVLSLAGGVYSNNTATAAGGAMQVDGDAALTANDLIVTDNDAATGGGIWVSSNAQNLTLSDNAFLRNLATGGSGGAVEASGLVDLASTRNFFCANDATQNGGGVHAVGAGVLRIRNDGASDNTALQGGVYATQDFTNADIAFSTYTGNDSVLFATGFTAESLLQHVAATASTSTAFEGDGTVLADSLALLDNGMDLGGAWAGATITHLLEWPAPPVPVFNSYPAPDCETTSLQPHPTVGTPLLDVGPGMLDRDNSLTDIGLSGGPDADPALYIDADGDTFSNLADCDDDRDTAFPGAIDFCNELDDNCNGIFDEDPDTIWFEDNDDDGFGDANSTVPGDPQCEQPGPHTAPNDLDCVDGDPDINPAAHEICDGIDNNCDLITDDDASDRATWYRDVDFDGFGVDTDILLSCAQPDGYVAIHGDCDDELANVYPGAEERCDTIDNDCNGVVDNDGVNAPRWYPDLDHDGWGDGAAVVACLPPLDHSPFAGDCDDNDPDRAPGNDEVCDGIDNDCDHEIDVHPVHPTYFPDLDLDGYGDGHATPIGSCHPIAGLVDNGTDCDDHNAHINEDAAESCDDVDEDCDGEIDNNPTNGIVYYLDSDGDTFGDPHFEIIACTRPLIAAENGTDCDDGNDVIFPGNPEVCDFFDNDCDGDVDEDDALDASLWYQDADGDGYGDDDATVLACRAPVSHVQVGDDCDDANPQAFPGLLEVCDGVDNDCNGTIDGPDADDVSFYFLDNDGDGFGDPATEFGACSVPEGYVSNDTDCDDDNADVFPGAREDFTNDIDEDCDGQAPRDDNGPDDTDPGEGGNCKGCSSGGSAGWWFMLPLMGLLLRRQRRA